MFDKYRICNKKKVFRYCKIDNFKFMLIILLRWLILNNKIFIIVNNIFLGIFNYRLIIFYIIVDNLCN